MITINAPIKIETEQARVEIGVWSDGSVSFETLFEGRERRYWLCKEHKGKILTANESNKLRKK